MRRILIFVLATASLIGCSPSPSKPGAQPVNDATSGEAGGAMASSIESGVSGFNPPRSPAATFGVDDELPATCFTYDPPVWTDTDLDFFPDVESTVTVDCAFAGTDGQFTVAGVTTYLDLAAGVPDFNFTSSYDARFGFVGTIEPGTPDAFEGRADFFDVGSDTATEGGAVFTIEQARETGVDVFDAAGNPVYGTSETTGWSLLYTPGGVWDRGLEIIPGQVSVNGGWEVDVRAGEYHQRSGSSVTTVVPLQVVDPLACATHVVEGQVRATFAENDQASTLDVTWVGCGAFEVVYTGPPTD